MSDKKIKAKVKLVGNLRKFGPHESTLELPKGSTVKDIVKKFEIPPEENIIVMVNEVPKYLHYQIKDGDIIDVLRADSGKK